ncbi:aspartate aminotransferase family protein [Microvirga sp. ACRRW]|uniref:aspartate aminotransferase family protein n=1 Tax=Microvirga sp. ACRRW TaxID=2918205 RepID=UPI001EF55AC3|nr:aspartate aminotransferase family protein [Microvirga sp. ACRRW]MCG7393399.1 aspartate aminotransferase family protein [Microvirga sp. ACRRW]
MSSSLSTVTNKPDAFWMPFTANRRFKDNPRLFTGAEGNYYLTSDGTRILDGMAGLWCVNAGHGHPRIQEAIKAQADGLDFVSSFNMGHPLAFQLAARITEILPAGLDHVFFTNSGSESVDTALKIALAYHRQRGEATRTKLVGRARGYHGMGFGGLSVSGISRHRRDFGPLMGGTMHLPHTLNIEQNAFSRGQPAWGAHLADELERLVQIHDASTIAAVIVEPVAGSTGVLPPPQGYLQRLREICTRHGILLIFDEVISGFGRMGASCAAEAFGVLPDMITTAKGLTNGAVPMGATIVSPQIYNAFMDGPDTGIELFHGYTYSAHPLACAAGLATLAVYEEEGLFQRAAEIAKHWEEAAHSLKGAPHVIDVRNYGLVAAVEFSPRPGAAGVRASECAELCYQQGVLVRPGADLIVLSPPLTIEKTEIDRIFDSIRKSLDKVA